MYCKTIQQICGQCWVCSFNFGSEQYDYWMIKHWISVRSGECGRCWDFQSCRPRQVIRVWNFDIWNFVRLKTRCGSTACSHAWPRHFLIRRRYCCSLCSCELERKSKRQGIIHVAQNPCALVMNSDISRSGMFPTTYHRYISSFIRSHCASVFNLDCVALGFGTIHRVPDSKSILHRDRREHAMRLRWSITAKPYCEWFSV